MEDEIRLQTLEEQIKNQDAKITEFADNFQTQFSELQQQWSDLNASLSRIATKMESWVPTMVVAEKGGHEATAKKPLLCTLEPHDRLLLEESPMALDKWEEGTLDTPLIACTVMEKCVLEEAENPEDGTKFDEKIRPVDDNADQKNLGTGGALSLLGSLYGLGEDEDSVTEDTPEIEKNASGKTNAANVPVPKSNRPYGCTSRNEQMVFDDMQFKIEDIKGSKKVIGIRMKSNKKLGKSWVENATGFTGGTIFARKYWVPYQCKMTQESAALVAVEDVGVGTWVATHSSHVTVDFAGSERVAESMKDSIPRVEWDFEGIHYLDKGPLTVQYLLVLDALNFCFWLDKELSYNHLASGLKAALEDDKSTFDADRIQKYTGPQLSKMLKWPRPLPLEDVSVDVLLDFCKLKLGVVTTKILKSWVEVVTRFKGGTFGDSYNFSRVVTSSRFTAKLIGSWHVHISWNPWLLVESDVARMTLLIPILHKLLFKHKVELNLPWDTVFNTGLAPLSRNVYGVLSRNYNFRNFFSCGTHFTLYAKTREGVLGNESVYILLALIRLVQDETEMNTLILIPLIKYVLIVLWANDHGEGGTFASSFRLKVPSAELERSLRLKERLETSLTMKKLILMLVLAGTSMVIADGVVTPAMSVMSAVGGLKVGVSGIKQDQVLMISIAILVILFSVQRYGTSKMGIVVGPALLIWFCSLGCIGIDDVVKYDTRALKAFNPVHIYYFYRRNSTKAWYSLGGYLLCVTGSEAMLQILAIFL